MINAREQIRFRNQIGTVVCLLSPCLEVRVGTNNNGHSLHIHCMRSLCTGGGGGTGKWGRRTKGEAGKRGRGWRRDGEKQTERIRQMTEGVNHSRGLGNTCSPAHSANMEQNITSNLKRQFSIIMRQNVK